MFAFIYASSPRMYSIFRLSITNRIESIFPNKSHQLFAMQKKKTPLFGFDENNARCWLAANTSKDSKQYRLYIVTILYTQLNPSQLIEQIHYRRCKERWNYGSDESKSTGEGPCCSSSSHMTSNPLSASPPHPTPLHSSPLLASSPPRPRARFGIPVPRPASKTTPSYRKIELWWKPRPSWNRVTLRHACHRVHFDLDFERD